MQRCLGVNVGELESKSAENANDCHMSSTLRHYPKTAGCDAYAGCTPAIPIDRTFSSTFLRWSTCDRLYCLSYVLFVSIQLLGRQSGEERAF
jgi:hypothetical protein